MLFRSVDEDVGGCDVAVNDAGAVDDLGRAEGLVDEELGVPVGELLAGAQDGAEIGLHEVHDDEEAVEVDGGRREEVAQSADVGVVEVGEQLDLAEDALGEDELLEDLLVDALDGDGLVVAEVDGAHDDTVAARADDLLHLVVGIELVDFLLKISYRFNSVLRHDDDVDKVYVFPYVL